MREKRKCKHDHPAHYLGSRLLIRGICHICLYLRYLNEEYDTGNGEVQSADRTEQITCIYGR